MIPEKESLVYFEELLKEFAPIPAPKAATIFLSRSPYDDRKEKIKFHLKKLLDFYGYETKEQDGLNKPLDNGHVKYQFFIPFEQETDGFKGVTLQVHYYRKDREESVYLKEQADQRETLS